MCRLAGVDGGHKGRPWLSLVLASTLSTAGRQGHQQEQGQTRPGKGIREGNLGAFREWLEFQVRKWKSSGDGWWWLHWWLHNNVVLNTIVIHLKMANTEVGERNYNIVVEHTHETLGPTSNTTTIHVPQEGGFFFYNVIKVKNKLWVHILLWHSEERVSLGESYTVSWFWLDVFPPALALRVSMQSASAQPWRGIKGSRWAKENHLDLSFGSCQDPGRKNEVHPNHLWLHRQKTRCPLWPLQAFTFMWYTDIHADKIPIHMKLK